ncbi:unnamed protein product [Cuscuta campestris]|uniref:Uncharacterized protein n=1 Tax=Cuscuta campestris TaxID=132261 RepID=A0A484LW92_9ASTE|nr:unnamed protein product [Cuscuta campestris]
MPSTVMVSQIQGVGYELQRGPSESGGRGTGTTRSGTVSGSGLLFEGVFGNDPKLCHLRAWPDNVDVGLDDEVHDEEGIRQAPLVDDGSAIRHVNHDVFRPIDGGAVHDGVNRLQVLVEEQGVAAIPGAEDPSEDVEEEALLLWGRVDRRRVAVADEVGDPELLNDHRLIVEDPIVLRSEGNGNDASHPDACNSAIGVALVQDLFFEMPYNAQFSGLRNTIGNVSKYPRRLADRGHSSGKLERTTRSAIFFFVLCQFQFVNQSSEGDHRGGKSPEQFAGKLHQVN